MGTKMHRGSKKRAALIGAAAIPAIAGLSATLMSSSAANAAVTFSITNQGTPVDDGYAILNGGTASRPPKTATGWTGYVLTIIADAGDKISAVDFGTTSAATAGVFGSLLQNWSPGPGTSQFATPVDGTGNGGDYALDSHYLTVDGRVDATSPFEDSNKTNPGVANGIPANGASDRFGTGTFLHGAYGIDGAHQQNSFAVAYVVLKNGTSATFNMTGAETSGAKFALTGTIPAGPGSTVVTNKIVSLTPVSGGAPTTYGSKLTTAGGTTFNPNAPVADSINVTGPGSGSYNPGFANNINTSAGSSLFFVQASGFNPGTDQEVYGLDLRHTTGGADTTPAEETIIANEINLSQSGIGVTAVPFASASAALKALFPTYDIFLLTNTNPNTTQAFLGLDLSQETGVGGLQAINVAAVPEPASAAGVLLGAAGLLLGRRKRNA